MVSHIQAVVVGALETVKMYYLESDMPYRKAYIPSRRSTYIVDSGGEILVAGRLAKSLSNNKKSKESEKMATSKSGLVVSTQKVHLLMAERCMNPYDVCSKAEISYPSYQRIIKTGNCKLSTLGKIAKALNVPVTAIIVDTTMHLEN